MEINSLTGLSESVLRKAESSYQQGEQIPGNFGESGWCRKSRM